MRWFIASQINSVLRLFGLKTVASQFLVAFLIICLLAGTTVFTLYFSLSASADTINMAGRQRMLSQKMAKEAMMVVSGVEQKATLDKTMSLFASSHQKLVSGDPAAGISPPATEQIKKQLAHVEQLWGTYQKTIADYLATPTGDGLSRLQKESPVILKEMNAAVVMMADAANASVQAQQMVSLLMTLGILLIALISGFCGMPWLMSQIKTLAAYLEKVRDGDLSHRIEADCSDNEVGHMIDSYNAMCEQVSSLINSVQGMSHKVSVVCEQLISETNVSECGSVSQSQELEQISSAMNEMNATVHEVANHANVASQTASEANNSAENGHHVVRATMNQIQDMAEQLGGAVSVMQELDADSQEIGKVLTVITGIAEQTNLLALNAAIEAARAGDQGRGFAVVADEVRTLAQRTQESTSEIQRIIERLQHQSHKAVDVMNNSSTQVKQSAEQAQRADEALLSIVDAVKHISDMNMQIATAAEEQSQVVQEMERNISNIADAASSFKQSCSSVQGVARNLGSETHELDTMVSKFKLS